MSGLLKTTMLILLFAACSDSTSPFANLSANNNADDFLFVGQTFDHSVTTTLHYVWQHTGTVAQVGLGNTTQGLGSITPVTGTASITIRDGSGKQVYTHDLRDNVLDTTATGTAGNWSIDLAFTDVRGDVVIEALKAPRDIIVTTATSGSNLDVDGYAVAIDGGASQSIDRDGIVTFSNLTPASHTVVISGVAANCTVADGLSRSATASATIPTTLAFTITCT